MSPRKITEDPFFEKNQTVSMSECTGLAPSGVTDDTQAEELSRLYSVHKPEKIRPVRQRRADRE